MFPCTFSVEVARLPILPRRHSVQQLQCKRSLPVLSWPATLAMHFMFISSGLACYMAFINCVDDRAMMIVTPCSSADTSSECIHSLKALKAYGMTDSASTPFTLNPEGLCFKLHAC